MFREQGFDGVGIASLMAASDLTHGGFYRNFSSKSDLLCKASAAAIEDNLAVWDEMLAKPSEAPLADLARLYISDSHVGSPETGCAVAAFGVSAAKQGNDLQRVFASGITRHLALLTKALEAKQKKPRGEALKVYALLMGALVLARSSGDPTLTKELREAIVVELAPYSA
jgi:TetR/AcrR family transcriptional repressor of nem operon